MQSGSTEGWAWSPRGARSSTPVALLFVNLPSVPVLLLSYALFEFQVSTPESLARLDNLTAGGTWTLPAIITTAGPDATKRFLEFFTVNIRNPHTRAAYERAARRFLAWCLERAFELQRVRPGDVGRYLDEMQ